MEFPPKFYFEIKVKLPVTGIVWTQCFILLY